MNSLQHQSQITCEKVKSKYSIIENIGEGAFGKVFKAKDKSTQKEVAIKMISNTYMRSLRGMAPACRSAPLIIIDTSIFDQY